MAQKTIVVALGGNAITQEFEEGNISQQFANTRKSLVGVAKMIKDGHKVVISHGNGPQVGNELIRVEMSRDSVPPYSVGSFGRRYRRRHGIYDRTMFNECFTRYRNPEQPDRYSGHPGIGRQG